MESPLWGRKFCVALLKACARNKDLHRGTRVHADILKRGLIQESCYIANALVSMYAKCGALAKAKDLLDELPVRDVFTWSAVIAGYAQHGQGEDAIICFEQMQHEGLSPDEVTFTCILKACGNIRAVEKGEQIHDEIVRQGLLGKDIVLGTALVDMYVKCGALAKARKVLDELPVRDVISWNALIAGYTNQGQGEEAVNCFEQMQQEGLSPDETTFICILKSCSNLGAVGKGEAIHDQIASQGLLRSNIVLGTTLVNMYIKFGAPPKAQRVLEQLPSANLVSWNALIGAYTQLQQSEDALICFERMQCKGLSPNTVTFTYILKACGNIKARDKGEQIHNEIARQGLLEENLVLSNALVDMYAKCGALEIGRQVLEELPVQNVVSWNSLIAGYAQQGCGEDALSCFEVMKGKGLSPDIVTFTCIVRACAKIGAAEKGEQIHDEICRRGLLGEDILLGNALVDMYAKCGALTKARLVLEELRVRDVVSWNALIAGYAQHEQGEDALNCFELMQREGLYPDEVTFICILKACGSIRAVDKGEQIHDEIVRQGLLGKNIVLGTALVDMYAKCGALMKARKVLEELPSGNVVSWNALIAGYVQQGQGLNALDSFEWMQRKGISPNEVTFTCVLQACGSIGAADKGDQIYGEIARQGLLGNNIVLDTALVDMYAKCGAFENAGRVLEKLPVGNVASWNALIAGYVQRGQGQEALNCFEWMQSKGLSPDEVTFTCILKACGSIEAAEKGQQIHDRIAQQGLLGNNIVLGTALVDMYAKCGALAKARLVLEELPIESAISWSALIAGYAQRGHGQEALNCFEMMQSKGLSPDAVTFSSILNACSHSGLVEEGEAYFTNMRTKFGLTPDVEHYTCMVDLFGRSGHFDKAVTIIKRMPSTNHPAVWSALLGACQKWGDVHVGRWAFEHAIQIDKSDAAPYVCMANIYTAAGMQEDAKDVEAMRVKNNAWKKPGCSWWIDVSGHVNLFSVGDTKHPQSKYIYEKLELISRKILQEGYSPSLQWTSNTSEDLRLCGHCEKSAIAYALINTPQEEVVRIVKNTPMCGDCHVATSLISRIEKRKIVVRDANCFHDFDDGKCSCGDCC